MQPLSAIDALGRGIANVRANWELLLAQIAAMFALALVVAVSIVPLVIALGASFADLGKLDGSDPQAVLDLLRPERWLSAGVLVAVVASLVFGTLAILVYSWFQAGVFGILVAGDRQAGAGAGRPRGLFRTFSWRDFSGWASRGTWRFFGWYHLYLTVLTLMVAALGALALAAISVGVSQGPMAGVGVGCGGALPLFFALFYVSLVFEAAKADLAREDSGAVASWRRGAGVVARRIGGTLLLFLLFFCASMAMSMLVLPLQLLAEFGLRDQMVAYVALQLVVYLVQWGLGSVFGLIYGASFVALVRAELPDAHGPR
ncbi:MAG: hypothetical protein AMXMBFR36_31250 [Acidobacteriota bacterium]